MSDGIRYRLAEESEIDRASKLACRVFEEFVSVQHSVAGAEEFHSYASTTALRERNAAGCVTFVADLGGRIVGMLHLRNGNHIAMLFVEGDHQRQRVGSGLVRTAEQYASARRPTAQVLTVASTPNAINAYRRMGFDIVGNEQVQKGLRFVPMERRISLAYRSPA